MSENLENGIFLIRNVGSGKYLNIWGTDQVSNSRNVCQYDLLAELNQLFWVQRTNSGVLKLSSIMQDSAQNFYSLNINGSTGNANLYREEASNDVDSAVVFENVEGSHYRIRLERARSNGSYVYLTAIGSGNGSSVATNSNGNVMWLALSNGSNQQVWDMEFMVQYPDYTFDIRKLDAQIFLHKFYNSTITIDAQAGTVLCRELVKALQQILLGLHEGSDGYGNFGPATLAACPNLFVGMTPSGSLTADKLKRLITLFCHAMFCKGYSTVGIYDTYNANVASGVKSLQASAGLEQDGIVTPQLMKAVFNTDSYELASKGDAKIREIQQAMNGGYNEYTGINSCDGIYGRATNNALIYAIQKEEGISVEDSAASFGPSTFSKFPTLPFSGDSKEEGINEIALTKILQYALYVNGYYNGAFDGLFSSAVVQGIKSFQEFMAYPTPFTDYADARIMKGLLASCGDQSRPCIACDTATILNSVTAAALYNAGYRYVGRYLTGRVKMSNGTRVKKALSREEAELIIDAGLAIIPIYQDGGTYKNYFRKSRGQSDAQKAYTAAKLLGIPNQSIIYFAVDYDALGSDIDNIIRYFEAICRSMKDYQVGIYGTRNVCDSVLRAGWAYKCYVSDLSTGYSGNLSYKMPDFWAFDQFGTDVVNGVSIDKVAYSGRDSAVQELWDCTLTEDEKNSLSINAGVRAKICDFQEDLPVLSLLPYPELEAVANTLAAKNITRSTSGLPDFEATKTWRYTLLDSAVMKVEYEIGVGVSIAADNPIFTFNVVDGSLSAATRQELKDTLASIGLPEKAPDSSQGAESNELSQEVIINLFEGLAISLNAGSASISIALNPTNQEVTISIAFQIPDLELLNDISVAFSQKLSLTLRPGKYEADGTEVVFQFDDILQKFGTNLSDTVRLGNALPAIKGSLGNEQFLNIERGVALLSVLILVIGLVVKFLLLV